MNYELWGQAPEMAPEILLDKLLLWYNNKSKKEV
jgi:hypothetical protein